MFLVLSFPPELQHGGAGGHRAERFVLGVTSLPRDPSLNFLAVTGIRETCFQSICPTQLPGPSLTWSTLKEKETSAPFPPGHRASTAHPALDVLGGCSSPGGSSAVGFPQDRGLCCSLFSCCAGPRMQVVPSCVPGLLQYCHVRAGTASRWRWWFWRYGNAFPPSFLKLSKYLVYKHA